MEGRRLLPVFVVILALIVLVFLAARGNDRAEIPRAEDRSDVGTTVVPASPLANELPEDEPKTANQTGELLVRVVDASDAPVPDAAISVLVPGSAREWTATTDSAGEALIESLPAGRLVTIHGKGDRDTVRDARTARIAAGKRAEAVLRFREGGWLTGIVQDKGGAPLSADFTLHLVWGEPPRVRPYHAGETREFAAGTTGYEIYGLRPGKWIAFTTADGYVTDHADEFEVRAGNRTVIDFTLGRGGTVVGTVFGPDGNPRAGAAVRILYGIPGFRVLGDGLQVVTDQEGSYRAVHLDPGWYEVRSERNTDLAPFAAGLPEEKGVQVEEGEIVRFDLDESARGTVRGLVTNQAGMRIPTRLFLTSTTETDAVWMVEAKGSYAFRGIEPGEYELSAWGAATREVEVIAGKTIELDVVVALGNVRVSVFDAIGEPDSPDRLLLLPQDAHQKWLTFRDKRTPEFLLKDVPVGRYRAVATGRGATGEVVIEVPSGKTVPAVIRLDSLHRAIVRIQREDGRPITGVTVTLSEKAKTVVSVSTDEEGAANFRVPPGEYRVRFGENGPVEWFRITPEGDNEKSIIFR